MHFLRRCDPCFAPSLYREWIVRPRPPMRLGPLGPPRKPSWPCLCQEPRPPSSLEYLGLRGEGSIPVPLPPPAGFGSPYFLGTMGSKSRRFCRCFCLGEFGGRLQLLSIGAGECIFLRNLRTSFGSPIPNLPEAKAGLGRFISNPSPSANSIRLEREVGGSSPPNGRML